MEAGQSFSHWLFNSLRYLLSYNEHQDAEIHLQGEIVNKDSDDIHIPGIDVGGGWRTGCGSHPQSAERVEQLEESVWSVVPQENERED